MTTFSPCWEIPGAPFTNMDLLESQHGWVITSINDYTEWMRWLIHSQTATMQGTQPRLSSNISWPVVWSPEYLFQTHTMHIREKLDGRLYGSHAEKCPDTWIHYGFFYSKTRGGNPALYGFREDFISALIMRLGYKNSSGHHGIPMIHLACPTTSNITAVTRNI